MSEKALGKLDPLTDDDPWLEEEEPDADDDQPVLDSPDDGIEWDEDDED